MSSTLTVLPSPDRFPAYARAVAQLPQLDADQEQALVARWRSAGDQEAARALVLGHLHLVVKAVREHEGYGVAPGDLAQEGTVGLMKAVHKFEAGRGARLGTYAWYWIQAEIREFIIKNWRLVSWGTSALAKKLFFGYRKTVAALQGLGENRTPPSIEEIATALDVDATQARTAQAYFLGADVGLWDEHDDVPSIEYAPAHKAAIVVSEDTPEDAAEANDRHKMLSRIQKHLPNMSARHRDVIQGRYLTDPPVTLTALAQGWGVSVERARQIETAALAELKDSMSC